MAAMVSGVREHLEHAESVLVVEGTGARARVVEVLCGFVPEATIAVEPALPSGQRAIVAVQAHRLPDHPELAVAPPRPRDAPRALYLLDKNDRLPPKTPERGGDGMMVMFEEHAPLALADVRRIAREVRPDDAAVQARVIELALGRARDGQLDGARVVAALHDVARDVPRWRRSATRATRACARRWRRGWR